MDCPSCHLVNLPEALMCDCDYNFTAARADDFPGWEITLPWAQKIAAFWSISLPALLGSLGVGILCTRAFSGDAVYANRSLIALAGYLAFFAFQSLLTRRLVRKDYRSFRLHVVRDDGSKSRSLTIPEAVTVWLWISARNSPFCSSGR
jgi:hypothetical protein